MISYVILHFNRLYLLDTNIRLIRKYAPKDTQIIVSDDGSDKNVVEYIKDKLPIDDIYVNSKNEFGQHRGSCSDTIRRGFDLCKGEHVIFSEDDFFPSPNPVMVNAKGTPVDGGLMPLIYFPEDMNYDFFDASVKILESRKDIHIVQMARDVDFDPQLYFGDEIDGYENRWRYLNHKKTKKYYHCNWPFMVRRSELKDIKLPSGLPIPGVESHFLKIMNGVWGSNKDWSCCPVRPYYIHVARGFSNQRKIKGTRLTRCLNMQDILFGARHTNDSKSLNILLSELYVDGTFRVNFNEVISDGLNEAFMKAVINLKGK